MKKMTLRFFSMLLVLSMVIGMVPMTVLAAPTEEEPVVETVVETVETEAVETESEDAASEEDTEINFSMSEVAAALMGAEDVEVDEDDPAIIAVETELQEKRAALDTLQQQLTAMNQNIPDLYQQAMNAYLAQGDQMLPSEAGIFWGQLSGVVQQIVSTTYTHDDAYLSTPHNQFA